jgi:hypothetical protein
MSETMIGMPVSEATWKRLRELPLSRWREIREALERRMNEAGFRLHPDCYIGPIEGAPDAIATAARARFTKAEMPPMIVIAGSRCMLHADLPDNVTECALCDSDVNVAYFRWAMRRVLQDAVENTSN